ncbi:hypothetical protein GCM10027511_43390 [Hymenobacter humi]
MKGILLMLFASICLLLANATSQAHPRPDHPAHATEFVDSVAIPQPAMLIVADSVSYQLVATGAQQARDIERPAGGTTARVPAAVVVAPPNRKDSLSQGNSMTLSEAKRQLRPDPGRQRKGYNYR